MVLLAASAVDGRAQTADGPLAPELSGLGSLQVPITTAVPRAQRFFDQGVRLLYAFNHAEALRAFREAARLDPHAPMPHWGQAMALGPNLNAPMTVENGKQAYEAIRRAAELARARDVTARELALVEALATRYASDGAGDRGILDKAYAAAMRGVTAAFPDDPDVQTLQADALMNTMPWDYWQKDGSPKPDTAVVLATLERVFATHTRHPGAHHYYIHALEASNDPDRAVKSADLLGALMPAAGHMVHMPAHIYIRVGRYADAIRANQQAIAADEDYLAQCQAQGLYAVSYYPHNLHFLWAAATLEGRSAMAIDAARTIAAKVPHHHAGALAWTMDFPVTPLLAYARFGRWQEILTEPKPPAQQPYALGIWHYARGLAFVARDRADRAAAELEQLHAAMAHEAFRSTLKDSPLLANLKIASRIVGGEIAAREGRTGDAIRLVEEAVAIEDAIPYNEPPVWHHPPRQVLGALLLEAGRAKEAEGVYREDLKRFRENGWSLFGLAQALVAQGNHAEAASTTRRFERAWWHADVVLTSSRILRPSDGRTTSAPLAAKKNKTARLAHEGPVEQFVRLPNGVRVAYVERGPGSGTPVLLLHGYTDSWRSFETMLPHLPASLRVIALSQRGHGHTTRPEDGYTPRDFADDAAAFMDALGLDSAVVVGHSMGATVAQRLAIDHPERVRALVLLGALAPKPDNAAVREFWSTSVATLTDRVDPSLVRDFQQSTIARVVPARVIDDAVRESLKVPARVWKAALEPLVSLDFVEDLKRIRVPTLLLWGDRDTFTLRGDQDVLLAAITGSTLVAYEGLGHSFHWEDPARIAADVAMFLAVQAGTR